MRELSQLMQELDLRIGTEIWSWHRSVTMVVKGPMKFNDFVSFTETVKNALSPWMKEHPSSSPEEVVADLVPRWLPLQRQRYLNTHYSQFRLLGTI